VLHDVSLLRCSPGARRLPSWLAFASCSELSYHPDLYSSSRVTIITIPIIIMMIASINHCSASSASFLLYTCYYYPILSHINMVFIMGCLNMLNWCDYLFISCQTFPIQGTGSLANAVCCPFFQAKNRLQAPRGNATDGTIGTVTMTMGWPFHHTMAILYRIWMISWHMASCSSWDYARNGHSLMVASRGSPVAFPSFIL
jgi:hypothetical protein